MKESDYFALHQHHQFVTYLVRLFKCQGWLKTSEIASKKHFDVRKNRPILTLNLMGFKDMAATLAHEFKELGFNIKPPTVMFDDRTT